MKKSFLNLLKRAFLLMGVVSLVTLYSCDDDSEEAVKDPIASFQFAVSESNYLEVTFTNYSQNATSYSWNFGDEQTSTETDPVHVYAAAGTYDVVLTATNAASVSKTYTQTITITDPLAALRILTGETSKEWRLIREGIAMGIGSSSANYTEWWSLSNNGLRPCVFHQTWTFNTDGTMVFDDGGMMWGEGFVFEGTDLNETCFEATAANMVNKDGVDVSAWLSGTHAFEYNPTLGKLTLTGEGAWMGLVKATAGGDVAVPQQSVEYDIDITEETGYDLLTLSVTGDGFYWQFNYVSYANPNDEPDVVEDAAPFGEDLADITPTEIKVTFASRDAADLVVLDTITSGSIMEFGVDDPADATAAKVGKFTRVADVTYQELQFQTYPEKKDIQFTNFTTVKIDVYFPSSNDYTGDLSQFIEIGFGDISETQAGWWTDIVDQQTATDIALDQWVTYTFDLTNALTRTDLDMMYLNMGGAGHNAGGTFYVRNLIFE
ncbi:MAG: PKD domain-containing protein [Salinivirgaceae bacterium]